MTNLRNTASLKNYILQINPDADSTVLEDLCNLVDRYKLKWVRTPIGGAYFIMSQLSQAKGLDEKDYVKHWVDKDNLTGSIKRNSSETLPGMSLKVVGHELATFKEAWNKAWGESLGRINSLWIGDWVHAYAYLIQGSTEVSKDFQKLGAKAIENATTSEIVKNNPQKVVNQVVNLIDENTLQDQIIKLAGYSTVNFRFEVGVKNTFETPDNAGHRRWDWVEQLPKVTKVYELKAKTISEQDVANILYNKHYLELAGQKYPNKPIEFIFTSPKGISWEAKSLIKSLMNNQLGYTEILGVRAKITFIDLQDIAERLVNNILGNNPIEGWFWLLKKLREEDLRYVVSPRTVSTLNSQISEAYEKGILIPKPVNNVVYLPTSNQLAV